ncbi:acetate--CoA ligase [Mycolicibacterium goodii]|nr:acetate--CoA ligase [Mycolicibacterium goodii]
MFVEIAYSITQRRLRVDGHGQILKDSGRTPPGPSGPRIGGLKAGLADQLTTDREGRDFRPYGTTGDCGDDHDDASLARREPHESPRRSEPAVTVIHKTQADWRVRPNFTDYDRTRANFDWSVTPNLCAGMGRGHCNIGYAAVDRHAGGDRSHVTALRFVGKASWDGVVATRDLSYAELGRLTRKFTNVLRSLGVNFGDRVFTLMGRSPELYITILGALRNGSVVSPLFAAFGPEPVLTRMNIAEPVVLVTTKEIFKRRIAPIRESLRSLRFVFVVDGDRRRDNPPGTLNFWEWMDAAGEDAPVHPTKPEDEALLHFTSGTTGTPKAAMHVHGAVAMHYITGLYALDLHSDDIFWCTADPGWVTGTSYGIIAPLLHGVTSIVDEGEFDADRWYRILAALNVSVWYTAPTAIRMLIKAGPELAHAHRFPRLRFIASVGEPLNAEAVLWGSRVLGLPIHDNWWQTETGGIMIANTPAFDIKAGSMGRPLPGVEASVVTRDDAGELTIVDTPDAQGELALKPGWPSMFRGYLNEGDRYRKCFRDNLYLTGDLVRRDADGYFWFIARADDVIKSSGHLIGPFEVENVLTDHPAVAEAGVIGKPDPMVGEVVKAFVTLKDGFTADDDLRLDILGHARKRLGAAVAPKELEFVGSLPHTRSGKIMRRLLKARELGLPEGDLSTVEPGYHQQTEGVSS